ncbi:hypothetical protein Salat_0596000 [Sesamum alatum]|uniref:Uncharacterized protein n=1 Tax=Sesamum alatum TaxID=300844 RepID=A0AAE1YQM0_9LAMI|nr:hypothetical protein Salat_0596000 [Sesamum alatum]
MQARITNRLRAKKGTLPPNVAPLTDSSLQRASSAPRGHSSGHLGDSLAPLEPTPTISPIAALAVPAIEIPSEDTEVAGEESKSRSEKRKAKQAADKEEENKNLKLVADLTECWKGTRTELWTPKCVSAKMEGEKLVPDWAISAQSSVLKTHAMAFEHHLSLRCSYLRKEKITSDEKLSEAQKQLEESNKLRTAAEERVKQLEAQLEDLTLRSRIEVDTARTVAL